MARCFGKEAGKNRVAFTRDDRAEPFVVLGLLSRFYNGYRPGRSSRLPLSRSFSLYAGRDREATMELRARSVVAPARLSRHAVVTVNAGNARG